MRETSGSDWLREFLAEYRSIYNHLSPEDRSKRTFSLCDFSQVCEIHWIRFVNPKMQVLAVHHLPSGKSDELHVYARMSYAEAPQLLEETLSSPPFLRRLTPEERERFVLNEEEAIFRTLVEGFLVSVFDNPPSLATIEACREEPTVRIMSTLGGSNFAWSILGDLSQLSPAQAAKKVFPSPQAPVQESEPKPDATAQGYGTYFYPPVWVGKTWGETFQDKTAFGLMRRAGEVVLSTNYRGHPMLLTTAGFVAVVCNTKEVALRLFNELMAGAIFEGVSAHVVHSREIGDIQVDLQKNSITRRSLAMVSPRTRQQPYGDPQLRLALRLHYQQVETDQLKRAFAKAEKLASVIPSDWISLFLAGYTHYDNFEYTQAFLMLWLIVEQHVRELWSEAIMSLTKKRRDKFQGATSYWSVDRSIELLNLMKRLSEPEYDALMAFKRKRNDIVHRMSSADNEDAQALLNHVASMLQSR